MVEVRAGRERSLRKLWPLHKELQSMQDLSELFYSEANDLGLSTPLNHAPHTGHSRKGHDFVLTDFWQLRQTQKLSVDSSSSSWSKSPTLKHNLDDTSLCL
jgi:hypothetical protein